VILVRRALAVLLAALVLVEAGGAARAIAAAGDVRCCCGAHSFARPCRCRACPAARGRTEHHHDETPAAPVLAPDGACHLAPDGDALVPLALFAPLPSLAAVAVTPSPPFSPSPPAVEHTRDPLRPPP
jgi:hypothetical protein